MRVAMAAICAASLALAGCGGGGGDAPVAKDKAPEPAGPRIGEAEMPEGGLPPFGERAALKRKSGSWDQDLQPAATPLCSFTEHPVSERPQ